MHIIKEVAGHSVYIRRDSTGRIDYVFTGRAGGSGGREISPKFVWEATLYPIGFTRGHSSIRFRFKDDCNCLYLMSAKNASLLFEALAGRSHYPLLDVKGYGFFGQWTVVKEGTHYSIAPVIDDED